MMHRHLPTLLLAGLALAAALAFAACAGRGGPDPAYRAALRTWTASRLLSEHNALRAEEDALYVRLAETRTGDLPPTAREAAVRSLEDSLDAVQAKRRAVDETLATGMYAQQEMRYPVSQRVLRVEPPAAPEQAPAAAAQQPSPFTETPAQPATAADGAQPPKPAIPEPAAAPAQAAPGVAEAAPPPAAPAPAPAPEAAPAKQAATQAPAPAPSGKARVLGVETARTPAGLEVRIRLEGNPARKLFTLAAPPRVVLDITGVDEPGFRLFNRTLEAVEARSLRLGWHSEGNFLRLVLDTDPEHAGRASLEQAPDGIVLRVAP